MLLRTSSAPQLLSLPRGSHPLAFTSAPSLAAAGPAPAPWALSCACLCLGILTPLVCRSQSHSLAPPAPTQRPVVKGANRRPSAGPLSGEADARRALVERGSRLPFTATAGTAHPPFPEPLALGVAPTQLPPHPHLQQSPAVASSRLPGPPGPRPQAPTCPCPLVSACPVAGSPLLAGQEENCGRAPQAGLSQIRAVHETPEAAFSHCAHQAAGQLVAHRGWPGALAALGVTCVVPRLPAGRWNPLGNRDAGSSPRTVCVPSGKGGAVSRM